MRNISDNEYSKDSIYVYGMANKNCNPFASLMDPNIVFYKFNNLGHKAHDCKRLDLSIIRREKPTTI